MGKKAIQIKTFISKSDGERLDSIIKKYKFKSRYELAKILIKRFIKYADPVNDEFVTKEEEEIFDSCISSNDYDEVKRGLSI